MVDINNISTNSSLHIAFKETLELLDWPKLCQQLSTFSSTSQGQRKCRDLEIPKDFFTSKKQLEETIEISALDNSIEGGLSFKGVNDIERIVLRCFKGGVSSGEELLKVAQTLRAARRLRRQVDDIEIRPTLSALLSTLTTLPELEKVLEFGIEEGGRVADRASEDLSRMRFSCKTLRLQRRETLQEIIRKYSSILQDTVIRDRNGRPVLAFKSRSLDQNLGMVHDSSSSGNTVFVEPQELIPLGNKIVAVEDQIHTEENRLLTTWSNAVGDNFSSLENLSNILIQLELALSRARYGNWLKGVPPVLINDEAAPIQVTDFRHPLLVWQESFEGKQSVVPVTFDVPRNIKVVAITGPNTGGKTLALKSMGLAALMARCGMFLPCIGRPSLPWCNQVLADIGDEQSLQQNLSTFSGHIKRIDRILDAISQSHSPTIVLLDEVGAGTDPTEGTAIAIALLRVLADRARLTIATTHFGELKTMKYSDPRFENASVAFNSETITPTYHLQWGIPGKSNALAIAKRLGLDSVVTKSAEELIGPKGLNDINQIIKGMEEQRQRQQMASEEAAVLLARTELLHEELLKSWQQQQKLSKERRQIGIHKLELSIREGQSEVRDLIRRLRQHDADGEVARTTGRRLKEIELQSKKEFKINNNKSWQPYVGERVRLTALGKSGEVISISDDGKYLTVLCGVFRSTVDLSSVESLDGKKPYVPEHLVKVNIHSSKRETSTIRTKNNTVDVRGMRVNEAEVIVDNAIRKTAGKLWVIHGIGTGKLKKGLRNWLSTLSYVEQVTDADKSEGGQGCSVVWLK